MQRPETRPYIQMLSSQMALRRNNACITCMHATSTKSAQDCQHKLRKCSDSKLPILTEKFKGNKMSGILGRIDLLQPLQIISTVTSTIFWQNKGLNVFSSLLIISHFKINSVSGYPTKSNENTEQSHACRPSRANRENHLSNEENGFTIAKVKVYGQRDLVAVVGNLMSVSNTWGNP